MITDHPNKIVGSSSLTLCTGKVPSFLDQSPEAEGLWMGSLTILQPPHWTLKRLDCIVCLQDQHSAPSPCSRSGRWQAGTRMRVERWAHVQRALYAERRLSRPQLRYLAVLGRALHLPGTQPHCTLSITYQAMPGLACWPEAIPVQLDQSIDWHICLTQLFY